MRAQEPSELRLSTAVGPAFALGKAGERWAALLNDGSARRSKVVPYPGATLDARDALREFGALRDGAADMAVGSALAWSAQLPVFGVYGLAVDRAGAARAGGTRARACGARARRRRAAAAGVVVVAVAPLGDRAIATFDRAITDPATLGGRTIRAMTIPVIVGTSHRWARDLPRCRSSKRRRNSRRVRSTDRKGRRRPSRLRGWRPRVSRSSPAGGAFADAMVFAVRAPLWSRWDPRSAVRRARCGRGRGTRSERNGARRGGVRRARQAGRRRGAANARPARRVPRRRRAFVDEWTDTVGAASSPRRRRR
jgi:hypothetical protein